MTAQFNNPESLLACHAPVDEWFFALNAVNVGSSTGWTDEKHMRYITSLEESFVNQLHNREFDSKGLFCQSPEVWHKTCYNGGGSNTKVDQGYWGTLETDGAEFRSSQIEYVGSSCSGFQENSRAYFMDSDTSTNFPQHERTSNASRSKNSGRFVASYSQWNRSSLPRTTAESSGQNFVDGETEGTHEQSRGYRKRRQKQKAGSAPSSREGQGLK